MVTDTIHTGIAEADGFALAIGGQRDLGRERERDAQTGAANRLAKLGVGLDLYHDAVVDKTELGILSVNGAGGAGAALEIVAAVGAAEELLLQGSFDGITADFKLNGATLSERGSKEQQTDSQRSP